MPNDNNSFEMTIEIVNVYNGQEIRRTIAGKDAIDFILGEAGILDREIADFLGV